VREGVRLPVERGERAVLAAAGREHAVVSAAQLADAGLGRHAIAHRLATGWLRRMHRGVYLVGPLEAEHSRAMAATLAVGGGALLSHYSAAVLWGLRQGRERPIDVTVVGRETRSRDGIRTHVVAELHSHDATARAGIPVTSPARTLLDLATTADQRDLARATEEAQVQRRVTTHSLNQQFKRYPRHRGTAALTKAIQTDPALTRSEAERRLLELIRAAHLPAPEVNFRVEGWEVDFVWRQQRLIAEVDGYAFHSSRGSFERDRRRDRDLQAAGYRALRFTWRQIVREPAAVVAELTAALLTRRAGSLR
jgi:very-short-patch-repair endonuclease/predicted transcriptional regulator of viral defense system